MTMRTFYVILVSAVCTLTLRALPFVLFRKDKAMPAWLSRLGEALPSAIMAVLVVYCLKDIPAQPIKTGVPQLLGQQAQALMQSGRVQTAEEYRQLWEIFCTVLDQFAEILGDTALTGEEFCRMLRLVLTQYSVGTIPATLDQVKVSEMTRADRRTIRALFLLGCNDHLLPRVNQAGGILGQGLSPRA